MAVKSSKNNHTGKFKFILVMVLLVSGLFIINVKAQIKTDEIPTVTLCQVNKTANDYAGKTVRIRAKYVGTFEYTSLVDESCGSTENGAEFQPVCRTESEHVSVRKYKIDCGIFFEPIYKNISGDPFDGQFVNVVVVGTVEIQNASKWDNFYNVLIKVHSVESASPIEKKD